MSTDLQGFKPMSRTRRVRVYLAGPMRGLPSNNGPAFAEAAAWLRGRGYAVWSPAEHDEALGVDASSLDIAKVFSRDLAAVCAAEAVVLMPGWRNSRGAVLERHTADVIGIPVYELRSTREGEDMVLLPPFEWRQADL